MVALHQAQEVELAGSGIERVLAQRIPLHQVRVLVQRGVIAGFHFFPRKEKVSQHHRPEAVDGLPETLVRVVAFRQIAHFLFQFGVNRPALRATLFQLRPKRANRSRRLVWFVEGDVERRHLRAVFTEHVQHRSEVRARKRPLAQHFLRVLIDINDHDAWIGRSQLYGAQAKTRVQRIELQALDEYEERAGVLGDIRVHIQ